MLRTHSPNGIPSGMRKEFSLLFQSLFSRRLDDAVDNSYSIISQIEVSQCLVPWLRPQFVLAIARLEKEL